MNLREQVKDLLKEELNLDAIDDDAKQQDYAEWDSLTYMRVVAAIERNFSVDITSENINNFNSVSNILKEIEKK